MKWQSGIKKLKGTIARASNERHRVLRLLGSNNLLVRFHVGWILTALQLRFPASRVV